MGIVLLLVKFLCSFTFLLSSSMTRKSNPKYLKNKNHLAMQCLFFFFACPGFISVSLGPPQVILIIGPEIACEAGDSIQLCLLCLCCSSWAPKERDYRVIATVTGQGSRNSEVCLIEGKNCHACGDPKTYPLEKKRKEKKRRLLVC